MNTTYSFSIHRPTRYVGVPGYSVTYHLHPGGVTGRVNRWNNHDFAGSAPLTATAGQLGAVLRHDVTGSAWLKPFRSLRLHAPPQGAASNCACPLAR